MARHLLLTCNARSGDLQLDALGTADWSVRAVARLPIPGVAGGSDACPMVARGDWLWLAWRGAQPMLHSFVLDRARLELTAIAALPVTESLCHLALSKDGTRLCATGGDQALAWTLDADGRPTALVERHTIGPLAHCVTAHGDTVLAVSCLGDRLIRFAADPVTGAWTERDSLDFPEKSGPRQVVIAPTGERAYVLTEASAEIVTVTLGATLSIAARLPIGAPDGPKQAAALLWSADGRALIATERASNRLFRLPLDARSGLPALGPSVPTPDSPRALHVDDGGAFVVALGFRGHRGAVYAVAADGGLSERAGFVTGDRPSAVVAFGLD